MIATFIFIALLSIGLYNVCRANHQWAKELNDWCDMMNEE